MSRIIYLRTGCGAHIISANLPEEYAKALEAGCYVGFYHELRAENVGLQIQNFLRQIMGKRCDARPALEISKVRNHEELVTEAFRELRRMSRAEPVIYSGHDETAPAYLEGYPVWTPRAREDDTRFLMEDRERIVPWGVNS